MVTLDGIKYMLLITDVKSLGTLVESAEILKVGAFPLSFPRTNTNKRSRRERQEKTPRRRQGPNRQLPLQPAARSPSANFVWHALNQYADVITDFSR